MRPVRFVFLLLPVLLSFSLFAQPPAQGPLPDANPNAASIGYGVILGQFETAVRLVLTATNDSIQAKKASSGVDATITYDYINFKPAIMPTLFADKPNENQAHMAIMITYHVTNIHYHGLPYPSRDIGQSVDLYISCSSWATGSGVPTVRFVGQQPYLDGNSFGEDALNFFFAGIFSNYVDGAIRSQLSSFSSSGPIPNYSRCNCLSVQVLDDQSTKYKNSGVSFGYNQTGGAVAGGIVANNNETVTVKSVKRLAARGTGGTVLYKLQEDVMLDIYVNQLHKQISLGVMGENDIKMLSEPAFVFRKPTGLNDMMVVIANMIQNDNSGTEDTQFQVYQKFGNFGSGTQILTITKSYWQIPRSLPGRAGFTKPIKITVPAYEVTLNVVYPNIVVEN